MRRTRLWLATVAAALGCGSTGCQTWMGGMTLPSPRYLQHYPQYFPPDPQFPLPRELATQTNPAGVIGGVAPPLGVPAAPAPPAPVPPGGVPLNMAPAPGN